MFVVKTAEYYLRSTVWTAHYDRASKYETREDAQAALDKAGTYTKPSFFKIALIVEVW